MFVQSNESVKERFLGGRIVDNGAYVGKFKYAYEKESKDASSQSLGLQYLFVSNEGQSSPAVYINYQKRDGTKNEIGMDTIQGDLMTMMRIRELKKRPMVVSLYDWDLKSDVDQNVQGYPGLCNSEIGIVWQKEAWVSNGKAGEQMTPICYFEPKTKKTAKEIIDGKDAVFVDKLLEKIGNTVRIPSKIRDEYEELKSVSKKSETNGKTTTYSSTQNNFDDDFNEDVPF